MEDRLKQLLAEAVNNNILPLTGRCQLSCVFCSHRYNPPGVEVYDLPPLEPEYVESLIEGLDPAFPIVIGESVTRLREGEPFSHPQILTILKMVRHRFPETTLQITTNGSLLTPQIILELKKLSPLEIIFSLNSSSAKGRGLLMGDADPLKVRGLIEEASQKEIPFHGSVVAMPHLVGWQDLKETLIFLEESGARTIRLFIPGFTSLTPEYLTISSSELFELHEFISYMQESLICPLLPEPPDLTDLEAVIDGVIATSPAALARLQRHDIIKTVNSRKPCCRVEAFNMIREAENPVISLIRREDRLEKTIIKQKNSSSGITVQFDIDPRHIKTLKNYAERCRELLLMTSTAAEHLWRSLVASFSFRNVKIVAVRPLTFGGSINCAGLLTVDDFSREIKKLPRGYIPDLLLLPPLAFDSRGNDLKNNSYRDLAELFPEKTKIVVDS